MKIKPSDTKITNGIVSKLISSETHDDILTLLQQRLMLTGIVRLYLKYGYLDPDFTSNRERYLGMLKVMGMDFSEG